MTNRELYIKAVELIGKEVVEVKQRAFLKRLIKKATPEAKVKRPVSEVYQEIVAYLNSVTGKEFKWNTPATKAVIRARLNDGFTVEEFKRVVDIKAKQWLTGDHFKYLRPSTLFGTKFEGYLQEWIIFKKKEESHAQHYQKHTTVFDIETPQVSQEDLQKQKEWAELSKKLLAEATKEDWLEYYQQERLFKHKAYTQGVKDPFVRNLYAYFLKKKKNL